MEDTIEDVNSPTDEEIITNDEPKELGLPADEPEVEPKDDSVEEVDALKQRNQELYEQLKKAKGLIRDPKSGHWVKKDQSIKEVLPTKDTDITLTELHSLLKANVQEEDTQEVRLYARSHGITITEALKLPEVKALLGVKVEYRRTSEAANTRTSRYGASKVTDDALLNNASKGVMPDNEEDMARLIRAGFKK